MVFKIQRGKSVKKKLISVLMTSVQTDTGWFGMSTKRQQRLAHQFKKMQQSKDCVNINNSLRRKMSRNGYPDLPILGK